MLTFAQYLREDQSSQRLEFLTSPASERSTGFLFPDGSFRSFPFMKTHQMIAKEAGLTLEEVLRLGIVRYVPGEGITLATALTNMQAQVLKDAWDTIFRNDEFRMDWWRGRTQNFGDSEHWTATTIRNWSISQAEQVA